MSWASTARHIVMYSTGQRADMKAGRIAGMTPFRNEKNSKLGRGLPVTAMVPAGHIEPAACHRRIVSHSPTAAHAVGRPPGKTDIKQKCLEGHTLGSKTFKVHLEGYNIARLLDPQDPDTSPRCDYFYFSDDGDLHRPALCTTEFVFMSQAAAPETLQNLG